MSVDMNKTEVATAAATTSTQPLAVRVNLLPPEIYEARQFKKTQGILAGSLIGVLALLGAGYGLSVLDANRAADELLAEQAVTSQLNTEKAKYARVPEVLTEVQSVRDARQSSMTGDVLWSGQVDQVVSEMPADMSFYSFTMSFDSPSGARTLDPLTDPAGVGTITVEAFGDNHSTAAAWLEAEAQHPGFTDEWLNSSEYTDENGKLQTRHTSTLRFTPEIYSGRYDADGSQNAETGRAG